MAEYNKEKYYWFKLKDDFFKRHDIKIIKSMPNGKDYVIFYLQLLCESLSHNGKLRFNEEIPYSEEMLSVITDTNIDVVRSAMKLFEQLKLVEIMDDQTIFMTKLQSMIGSTTLGAEKKMLQREKSTQLLGGGQKVDICPLDIDIDIDIEKEIEIDKEIIINNKKETNIDADAVFDRMLKEMEEVVPAISFETFFKNLKHKGINEDKLVLYTSGLIANTIDGRYKEKVCGAIAKASNGEIIGYEWDVEI